MRAGEGIRDMQMSRSREHLDDEHLLAYLDSEMNNMRARAIRTHLDLCWRCRSALSDLEAQAEAVSRLLTDRSTDEIARSLQARKRFLQWRAMFEARQRFFFRSPSPQNHEEFWARCACMKGRSALHVVKQHRFEDVSCLTGNHIE
jgi:anti-sigma factor RsiW